MTLDSFRQIFPEVDPSAFDTSPEADARRRAEREARERGIMDQFFSSRAQDIIAQQVPQENRFDAFGKFDCEGDPDRRRIRGVCMSFASEPKGRALVLIGGCGRGKTLLATSIARVWLEARVRDLGNPVDLAYTTEQALLERYQRAKAFRSPESTDDVMRYYSARGLLIIDELGKWKDTGDGLAVLESLLDHRLGLRPTVMLSNLTPEDFQRRYTGGFFSRVRSFCFALPGVDHRGGV